MNIAETVAFDGLKDFAVPEELIPFVKDLVRRLEALKKDLIYQLRAESTVFYADPVNEPEKILGWKPGDVAVWVDSSGNGQLQVLGGTALGGGAIAAIALDNQPAASVGDITCDNQDIINVGDVDGVDISVHAADINAHHARQHVITAAADHTSAATPGQMLEADANGLPVDATNTDVQVAAAVAASHPQAHKDTHDPQTGGDPVDCAAAGEIVGVAAAAEGNADTLARSNHIHQVQHSIVNNHIVTMDDAGPAVDDDYAKFTANGLEGRDYGEVRGDLNVADGADVAGADHPHQDVQTTASPTFAQLSLSGQSAVFAYRTADQVIANNVTTTIVFDAERFDVLGEFNTGTGVFTAQEAGKYQVNVCINWQNIDADKPYIMVVRVNGDTNWLRAYDRQSTNQFLFSQQLCGVIELAAEGTIEARVYQNSGGVESIDGAGADYLTISIAKIA